MMLKLLTAALLSAGLASSASAQRVGFFDTWNVDVSTVAPGAYSYDSWRVDATGSLLFDTYGSGIALNYIDESGVRITEFFDVNAEATQAVGSGTFTVRRTCPISTCLWIDIKGTMEVGSPAGYIVSAPFPVPEPATFGMLALGLLTVGAAARRRHAA